MTVGVVEADQLQKLMEEQQTVTTSHESTVQREVHTWAAIRESNRDLLKMHIKWPADRDYIIDPLGERIPEAFADFMYGENPVFVAGDGSVATSPEKGKPLDGNDDPQPAKSEVDADEDKPERVQGDELEEDKGKGTDQDRLDDLVEANAMPTELHEAAKVQVGEGEVWYRIYRDDAQSDYPIIEWHSRTHVRPLFRGRKLIAVAFVSDIYTETVNDNNITYKYVDIQTENYSRNLLFKGENGQLGQVINLKERTETKELPEDWQHNLGFLAGRIANRFSKDRRAGVSEFNGVKDLIFSLNEATTIGHENARMTLKKRLAIPREALNANGKFDAGEDVLVMDDPLDEDMSGGKAQGKFAVLEYSFDAAALIAYKTDLANIIITRVGLAKQLIDPNTTDGNAGASGTALRVRLIPTTMAAKGKSRPWDDELPLVLMRAQMLDALPTTAGGFGRRWAKPGEAPIIERADPIPVDETENTNNHVAAVGAEIESRYTAIKSRHPDWDDAKIKEEIKRIIDELKDFTSASGPAPPPAGFGEAGTTGNGVPNPLDPANQGGAQDGQDGAPGNGQPPAGKVGAFANGAGA